MTDQQRDQYEERAAILEYDAGFDRAAAERMAREMVIEKHSNKNRLQSGGEGGKG